MRSEVGLGQKKEVNRDMSRDDHRHQGSRAEKSSREMESERYAQPSSENYIETPSSFCPGALFSLNTPRLALHVIHPTTFSILGQLAICFEAAECGHGGFADAM